MGLTSVPSEPHYIWQEGGTNHFSDHIFTTDSDPSTSNSTSETDHLVTRLKNAGNGKDWRSYQEDISGTECPISSSTPC